MTTLSDISFGTLMILKDDFTKTDWRKQIQVLLASGKYKCSKNLGIKLKGISSETLFFTNDVNVGNTLTTKSLDISNEVQVSGSVFFEGTVKDLSGNSYAVPKDYIDLSGTYNILDISVNDVSNNYPFILESDKFIIIYDSSLNNKRTTNLDTSYIDISNALFNGLLGYVRELSNNFLKRDHIFLEDPSYINPPNWWNNYNDLSYSDFEVWAAEKTVRNDYYGGIGGISNFFATGDISNTRLAYTTSRRSYIVNPWISPYTNIITSNPKKLIKKYYIGLGLDISSNLNITAAQTESYSDISLAINNITSSVIDVYQPPTIPPPPRIMNSDGTTNFGKPWVMPINPPTSNYLKRPQHIAKLLSLANFGKKYCDEGLAKCFRYPINSDETASNTYPLDVTGQKRYPLLTDPSNIIIVLWGLDFYNEIAWGYPLMYGYSDLSLNELYPTEPSGGNWDNHPELKFSVNASFDDNVKPGVNDMNVWIVFQSSSPIQLDGSYSIKNGWIAGSQGIHISTLQNLTLQEKECGVWTKKIPDKTTYGYGV
tara:strand:- start:2248 stop:3870 length:1623 start_codon:yes stop_codon:yes gene_type:complete